MKYLDQLIYCHINLWPCYLFCLCPIYPSFPFHHYLNIYRHTDCLSLKFCLFYSFSIYVLIALYLQHRLCHFMYSIGLCLSTTALSFIYYCCHGSYAYKIVTVWYKSQVKQLLSEEIKIKMINASLYSYATPGTLYSFVRWGSMWYHLPSPQRAIFISYRTISHIWKCTLSLKDILVMCGILYKFTVYLLAFQNMPYVFSLILVLSRTLSSLLFLNNIFS